MSKQTVPNDTLEKDLDEAIDKAFKSWSKGLDPKISIRTYLKEELMVMIVHRDHKVLEHGINLGKESK